MSTRSACGVMVLGAFCLSVAGFFWFNNFWVGVIAFVVAIAIGAFYFIMSLE